LDELNSHQIQSTLSLKLQVASAVAMQHRHEELEATVMKGGESSTVKIIQTQKEAAADAKVDLDLSL